ncbi:protein phosphatase 2C 64 [Phytophthora nicotianae]|nr:protein phosphatase 2C 64 [Phytophthora nicotianae]
MFEQDATNKPQLIRMDQRFSSSSYDFKRKASTIGWWTTMEHEKFLEALELYPSGPWKKIAHHIGSRTPRQVMTHAQKYRQRIKRRDNSKSRSKSKGASSKVVDEIMPTQSPVVRGEGDMLSEVLQLEPLPLLQICESEIIELPNEEVLALDESLLDELQQLVAPVDNAILEPVDLSGDELIELVDSVIDWTPVIASSCMLLS